MNLVLDTDVASQSLKGTLPDRLQERLIDTVPIISFITVGELAKWSEKRDLGPRRRTELEGWIDGRPVIWCDRRTARVWGWLAAASDRRGRPRAHNDTWIAACCLAQGLPLATRNVKHYEDFAQHHGLELVTG
jgi:predicted nucleic acid-binding protein